MRSTAPDPAPPTPGTPGLDPLVTVARTGSTQDDLRAALAGPRAADWPHLSALRALRQTAGRGRTGRAWLTPDEGALTVSVVLRPLVPASRLPWLPLLAGLAVCEALAPLAAATPWRLGTKWPNDVVALPGAAEPGAARPGDLSGGQPAPGAAAHRPAPGASGDVAGWGRARKVAGLLAELVAPGAPQPVRPASPEPPAHGGAARAREPLPPPPPTAPQRLRAPVVVLGAGVNVAQEAESLPVPWATSLRLLGVGATPEEVLALLGRRLAERLAQWEALGGDPDAGGGGLGRDLRAACTTLGQDVSVQTPSGPVRGRAVDLTPALVLDTVEGRRTLQAGDVVVLRTGGDDDSLM